MPRKFTKGLGEITLVPIRTGGVTVTTSASGSYQNQVLGDLGSTNLSASPADPVAVITSETSAATYHSTLFADFDLTVTPIYNFYVEDELAPTSFPDDTVPISDLPRYVLLEWNRAPSGEWFYPQVSRKGRRPPGLLPTSPASSVDFPTAKGAVANGYLNPGTVRATIVPSTTGTLAATANDDSFLSDPSKAGKTAVHPVIRTIGSSVQLRASFVDPSIGGGALSEERISLVKQPEHVTPLAAISKLAGPLEVISQFNQDFPRKHPIPTFPAEPDQTPARYIGYVIERYDAAPDGTMRLGRTIDVDDISVGRFVDRQVAYQGTYSYRMRSILRWTRPQNIGFDGPSPVDLSPTIGSVNLTRAISSFYAGDWTDWSRTEVIDPDPPTPPDEFTVFPRSHHGSMRVSWKQPSDRKRDIESIEVLRRVPGGTWESLGKFPPTNGAWDDPVTPGTPFIYTSACWSVHGLVSALSEQVQASLTKTPKRGESPVVQISQAGARYGTYERLPGPAGTPDVLAKSELTFFCRSAESDQNLALRAYEVSIRSLSTGERVNLSLTADAVAKVGPIVGRSTVQRRKGS